MLIAEGYSDRVVGCRADRNREASLRSRGRAGLVAVGGFRLSDTENRIRTRFEHGLVLGGYGSRSCDRASRARNGDHPLGIGSTIVISALFGAGGAEELLPL